MVNSQLFTEIILADTSFSRHIDFSAECIFRDQDWWKPRELVFGALKPNKKQHHQLHGENERAQFYVHAIGVFGSYIFSNETFSGVDYYQILGIYVQSKTQQ